MKHMGWSWADLKSAPLYVRRFCWDFRSKEIAAGEREQWRRGPQDNGDGMVHVRR